MISRIYATAAPVEIAINNLCRLHGIREIAHDLPPRTAVITIPIARALWTPLTFGSTRRLKLEIVNCRNILLFGFELIMHLDYSR